MSPARAASLLLVLGLARPAMAQVFSARDGTSGALDVPDGNAMPLGNGGVFGELRLLHSPSNRWSVSPAAALGVGLSHGVEVGFSLHEGGAPGDPNPSPLLLAAAVKVHLLGSDEGLRPALAVAADLEQFNWRPVVGLRAIGSLQPAGPFRAMAFVGAELNTYTLTVGPTAGLAAVLTWHESFSVVGEAVLGPRDIQVGGALRWQVNDYFGTAINVTHLIHASETVIGLSLRASTGQWLVKKIAPAEEKKPPEEAAQVVSKAPMFLDERPHFRLRIKIDAVPADEEALGRHRQDLAGAPAPIPVVAPSPPAPVAEKPEPAPAPAPAPAAEPKKYQLIVITKNRIELKHQIKFASGSAKIIGAQSMQLLDEVAQALQDNPQIDHVRIEGHTDTDGSEAFNLTLSQHRAESVKVELVKRKIDPGRLTPIGYGQAKPIASNLTKEGKAQNRRTEFNTEQAVPLAVAIANPPVVVRAADGTPVARTARDCVHIAPAAASKGLTRAQRAELTAFTQKALAVRQDLHIEARAPATGGSLVEASRRAEEVEAVLRKAGVKPATAISVEVVRTPAGAKLEVVVCALAPTEGAGVAPPVAPSPVVAPPDLTTEQMISAAVEAKVRTLLREELRAALAELIDAGQPVAVPVDAGQPAAVRIDAGQPAARVDAGQPAARVDAGQPPARVDAGRPAARVDAGQPAVVRVDAGQPAAVPADAGQPVAAPVDAGRPAPVSVDAGQRDAGRGEVLDAGRPDAGRPDAGRPDAGQPDAGRGEAPDAGRADAGRPDAGHPAAERLLPGEPGRRQIRDALLSYVGTIRRCVESQLKRNPRLNASGDLKLLVDAKGRVSHASIESGPLRGTYLEDCLRLGTREWLLPYSGATYELLVPLNVLGTESTK